MLSSLLESGLQSLLELGELATGNKDKIIAVLRKHWTLSAYQMSEAYQLAFKDALSVIQNVCSPSLLDVAHSKIKKQFKRQVHSYYLPTFFHAAQPETAQFKTQLAKACGNLQSFAPQLFAAEIHSELDLAVLVSPKGQINMTALLLQQLKTLTVLETEVEAFLLHQNLLGNAIEFFLRNNPSINERLTALQTAGIYDELQKVTALISRLEAQGIAPRIEAEDEFKHVSSQSMQLIGEAVGKLKRTPLNPAERAKACLMAGSAAFSLGELEEARHLLEQALQLAQQNSERALVHFNLFQVYLRYSLSEFNQIAFEHLQEAIELDRSLALHDPKLFRLEKLLGAGGMGCAFLATWLSRKRLVVLKCFWQMPQGEPHEVFNEALAMERVDSRYVPRPLSEGFYGEKAFLVTEYIENAIDGEMWLAQRGVLQGETGFQVALSLARGLQAAHECGVLHLDLKPSNLLLLETAEGVTVRIIDFGLSHVGRSLKQKALSHSKSSTLSLKMAGTWDYAAPEMKDSRLGKPTAKTDVFSYGKTLMQLYSGKRPEYCLERDLPEAVRHILCDCVEVQIEKRPAVADLIVFFENALGLDKQRLAEELAAEEVKKAAKAKAKAEKKAQADLQQKLADLEAKNAALSQEKQDALKQAQTLAAEIEALMAQTQAIQSEEQKARLLAELAEKQRQAAALAAAAAQLPKVSPSQPAKVTNFQETEFSFETVTVEVEPRKTIIVEEPAWFGLTTKKVEKVVSEAILKQKKRQCKARQITHKLPNGVPLEMVYIPEGELEIYGKTFHLQPFYMGKYAVTQAQYKAVMGENPSYFKGDNLPAENMTWKQAKEFCQKLGNGFRLPSEAEWEYACRAGTTTEYHFGYIITPELVNYNGNYPCEGMPKGLCRGKTVDVGSFPPNAFGLYDMHGNVWEWCQDEWHRNFADASADGTAYGSENGDGNRPLRGGSWGHHADDCRSAFRCSGYSGGSDDRHNDIGFRVVSFPP
ncbi:MAG: hypothetical protein RL368_877 [Pseudomonadota bacterium]|jgi:formylglycine-generating enzyme required for sulfatase activity/tetratricopeptide (TPR) repeat protein